MDDVGRVEVSAVEGGSSLIRGPRGGGGGLRLGEGGGGEGAAGDLFSALLSEVVLDLGWFCCFDLGPEV